MHSILIKYKVILAPDEQVRDWEHAEAVGDPSPVRHEGYRPVWPVVGQLNGVGDGAERAPHESLKLRGRRFKKWACLSKMDKTAL